MGSERRPLPWRIGPAAGAVLSLLAGAASGQVPPPPGPLSAFELPAHSERRLANGARVIVVEHREQPFVSVALAVRVGSGSDPRGKEGTADLVSRLLTAGTSNRSGTELAEAVELLGGTLEGSAGVDWTTVGLEVLTPSLEEGLVLMADVVRNPRFPADEVELARAQVLQNLELSLGDPELLANRHLARAAYGEHPYGRLASPASVSAVSRDDLVAFHDAHFRPTDALFVVAGDVSADEAAAAIARVFGDWTGTARGAEPATPSPPAPEGREILLVDKPGSVQAALAIGHSVEPRDEEAWAALEVATEVLGGGSAGRLFRTLREERGWTYAASAGVGRRIGPGLFRAAAMVRPEVADSALSAILAEIERLRSEPVTADELEDVKSFLAGSFPLRFETPQQIGGQLLRYRLLGLDPALLEGYRARIMGLQAGSVTRAAAEYLEPGRSAVVVVGDARSLAPRLAVLGAVRVVNVAGVPLSDVALGGGEPLTFDGGALAAGRWEYEVRARGQQVGSMSRTVTKAEGPEGVIVTVRSELEVVGAGTSRQEVTFEAATFRPVRASVERDLLGDRVVARMVVVGDSVRAEVERDGAAPSAVVLPLPPGSVLGEMQEIALWLTDLESVRAFELEVLSGAEEGFATAAYRVLGETQVEVPAGPMRVWEVEIHRGEQPQRAYFDTAFPHHLVKLGDEFSELTLEYRSRGGG